MQPECEGGAYVDWWNNHRSIAARPNTSPFGNAETGNGGGSGKGAQAPPPPADLLAAILCVYVVHFEPPSPFQRREVVEGLNCRMSPALQGPFRDYIGRPG